MREKIKEVGRGVKKLLKVEGAGRYTEVKSPERESNSKKVSPKIREDSENRNNNSIAENETYKAIKKIFQNVLDQKHSDNENIKAFEKGLRENFDLWKEIQELQPEYEKANMILTCFYATDKIRNQMEDFLLYVKDILEIEESARSVIIGGFNGNVGFFWNDYRKLMQKLAAWNMAEMSLSSMEQLLSFLQDIASKNEAMGSLAAGYMKADRYYNAGVSCDMAEISARLNQSYRKISGNNSVSIFELQEIKEQLEQCIKDRRDEIEESRKIQKALSTLLTEDIIEGLRDKEAGQEILTKRYQIFAEKTAEILKGFPEKE